MADYSCGLWDDRGWGTSADDEEINAPDDFVKRFNAWVEKYDDNLDGTLDVDSFNKEGRALAAELKKIAGSSIKVTYAFEKPVNGEYTGPIQKDMP